MTRREYHNILEFEGRLVCRFGMDHEIIPSYPPGEEYCKTCVNIRYEKAPVCPYCGIKKGFATGTGDCGCEVDRE